MSDDLHRSVRTFIDGRFAAARSKGDDESLLESGVIDSLGILDLAGWVGDTYNIELADDELNPDNFDSVAALVRFLESKAG